MLTTILLLACTPPPPEDVTGTDDGLAIFRTVTLPVSVEGLEAGHIEIRPDRDGMTIRRVLASGVVQVGGQTLSLPELAPYRDRDRTNPSAPITYRLALRADEGGLPGAYVGVSDARLVYFPTAPDPQSNAERGWNITYDLDSDFPSYSPISDGVDLAPTIVGDGAVAVSGTADVPWGSTTHVAVVSQLGETFSVVLDSISAPEWSVRMDVPPPGSALTTASGLRGAMMDVIAYDDLDADGLLGESDVTLGTACHGGRPIVLSYFDAPYNFDGALALHDMNAVWGYSAVQVGDSGAEIVDPEHLSSLVITQDCGVQQ
jgi:hypothetical protein